MFPCLGQNVMGSLVWISRDTEKDDHLVCLVGTQEGHLVSCRHTGGPPEVSCMDTGGPPRMSSRDTSRVGALL